MKKSFPAPTRAVALFAAACAFLLSHATAQLPPPPPPAPKTAPPVAMTGANGKVVQFLGIKSATPKGITVQMTKGGPLIGITWDKLDLEILQKDHPHIFAAYQSAINDGETTVLNLGAFEDVTVKKSKKIVDGYYENSVSGIKFAIQMPAGKPKGVLVLLLDPFGESIYLLPRGFDRVSIYPDLRQKYRLALLAFNVPNARELALEAEDPIVFVDKRSGPALVKVIELFGKDSGHPELAKLPILFHGVGKTGAAFAYNFTQWKPGRVLAAVVSNGAFYSQTPTKQSAKVPLLFLWGQYNEDPVRWKANNTREEVFKANAALKPNWVSAMEYHGRDHSSQLHDYFARQFLRQMIDLRTSKEKPKEAAPEDPEEKQKEKQNGEKEEETEKPEPLFADIPRDSSYVGDMKTFEYSKIEDPDAPLGENQTWLPSEEFAKMWQAFGLGSLEPPPPN